MTPTPEMIEAACVAHWGSDYVSGRDIGSYRAMESALKAAFTAMWQPIEKAPTDGTNVLLLFPAKEYRKARVDRGYYCDDSYSKKPRPYWTNSADMNRVSEARASQPSHFIPLTIFEDRK